MRIPREPSAAALGERAFDLVVAAAADSAYAWPAVLTLLSTARRSTARIVSLLVGDRLEEPFVSQAREVFDFFGLAFEYVDADLSEFGALPLGGHFSRAIYGRLLVVDAATRLAPMTLYLDSDVLAVRDIAPLAGVRLDTDHVVAAVQARGIPTCGSVGGIADWKQRGFDPAAPYFNSGVLLIDNDGWTHREISAHVLAYLRGAPLDTMFGDQAALNAVLMDRWKRLPWWWNYQVVRTPAVRLGNLAVSRHGAFSLAKVRMLHYFQSIKPWDSRYPPGYLRDVYRSEWVRLLPVPLSKGQRYHEWLRRRY